MTTQRQPAEWAENPFHMGDRIRKARELAGYSELKTFAEATGLDRGALGRYEATGEVKRRSTLAVIAWHTPVNLEWLQTGHGPVFKDEPNGPLSDYSEGNSALIVDLSEWGKTPRRRVE